MIGSMRNPMLLLAAALVLAACSSPVRLMPTPTMFTGGDATSFDLVPERERSPDIEIYYATNRLPLGTPEDRHYSRQIGSKLHLGIARLRIGDASQTWDTLRDYSTASAIEDRPLIELKSLREMAVLDGAPAALPRAAHAFFDDIDALLARSVDKDLVIYVHGANTTFERAAAQAAQYRHFTGRNSVVLLFSWPSQGTLLRYSRDIANARQSAPVLAALLELLSRHTDADRLNVLAYSAGATVTSNGLARAGRLMASQGAPIRLGEIYYAAPDVDFPVFVRNLPDYVGQVRRITVAVNLSDRVLRIAQRHQRVSRAGLPDFAEIDPEEARWLGEATRREGLDVLSMRPQDLPGLPPRSHQFWYDHPWVSTDTLLKFRWHAPPVARGLQENHTPQDLEYWTFPADFEQRLPAVVAGLGNAGREAQVQQE